MRIIAKKALVEFYTKYHDSKNHLEAWYYEVRQERWHDFSSIKAKYRSASLIADNRVVFNVCGNKYRLIVKVNYKAEIVFVRFIGTHKEYDKINAAEV